MYDTYVKLLLAIAVCASAFLTKRAANIGKSSKCLRLLTATGDYDRLCSELFDTINNKLDLKVTDYSQYNQVDRWNSGDWKGNIDWYDENMGAKLTGVSRCSSLNDYSGASRYSLNCWVGPSLLVPHMMLSFGMQEASDGELDNILVMDYVPRGATPFGSDNNYVDEFFGNDVLDSYEDAVAAAGAFHLPPSNSFYGRLLSSPVRVAVSGSKIKSKDVEDFARNHVDRWLHWIISAQKVEARQRGAINTRDDKLRQYAYRAAIVEWRDLVGKQAAEDLIKDLAAGSTGPLAEAYIGGGS